jgi:hypothetical protein
MFNQGPVKSKPENESEKEGSIENLTGEELRAISGGTGPADAAPAVPGKMTGPSRAGVSAPSPGLKREP